MTNPQQPPEAEVQRLLGEHYEEVTMEATFQMALLDWTRQAVASRARPRYRLGLALAAGAALLLAVFALQVKNHRLAPAAGGAPAAGKTRLVLITVRGDVQDGRGHVLKVGDQLAAGQTVRTGKASYLVMVTRQGSGLALDAKSELTLARDGKSAALRKGQVYCRNWKHEFAAVTTPAGKIQLLGTVINAAMKSRNQVAVTVVEGKVKLANTHGEALVPAGRKAMLIASAAPDDGTVANVLAETAWVEGTLYFTYAEHFTPAGGIGIERIALTGSIQTDEGLPSPDADRAPSGDAIVWSDGGSGARTSTILITRADGSDTDLGAQAGLTGLNCMPKWSPDGTMIAFQHCDAVTGKPHCQEGFSCWVMNVDGSNAHAIAPPDMPSNWGPTWFPDGTLLVEVKAAEPTVYRVNLASQEWAREPVAMGEPDWSPNREHLVYTARVPGTQHGEPGVWHQLVLADALGGDPRVLVQQFVSDDQVAQYYPTVEQRELKPDMDWIDDLQYHLGPAEPQWSPSGDQIAFRAALPFDPAGPYFREQVQIWIYDLNAEKLVQVTYTGAHYSLVWSPNKLPVRAGGEEGGGLGGGGGG